MNSDNVEAEDVQSILSFYAMRVAQELEKMKQNHNWASDGSAEREAKADLDKYYAQKHAAELLELLNRLDAGYRREYKGPGAMDVFRDFRKAVEEHFNV